MGRPAGVDEVGLDQPEAAHALAEGGACGLGEGLDDADEVKLVAVPAAALDGGGDGLGGVGRVVDGADREGHGFAPSVDLASFISNLA